jgi:alginate O-acetyltransferase complex protein AlgI
MLFSSYEFLLLFLPLTLAGFAVARLWGLAGGRMWLLAASAIFYLAWNPRDLAVLGASIAGNFLLARWILRLPPHSLRGRGLLAAGIVANLTLLGAFKYAWFVVETVAAVTGADWTAPAPVLPLAISFFTFQQIAYLVDAYRLRGAPGRWSEYALFVTFFPQLIAGPIVHHAEVLGQFRDRSRFYLRWETVSVGAAYFAAGLVKKVLLADTLAPTADGVFAAAAQGVPLAAADAWAGTLAYTLQLYFDFSGYSDMAIGLGWMFGVRLPANFNSPYQAQSLGDFWRRWHMTLSRFLRDYLYIPLGGNRCGPLRRSLNLLATMLLGGLWHGAGWTFVAWGALHGVFLIVQHLWTNGTAEWRGRRRAPLVWQAGARSMTLLAVIAGWVLFRSADLSTAGRVYRALCGIGAESAQSSAWTPETALLLGGLLLFVLSVPNTQTLIPDPETWNSRPVAPRGWRWLAFRPTPWHGAALSVLFLLCLTLLTRVQEFLYFQF